MRRKASLTVEPMEGRTLLSGLSYSLTTDASVYQAGQPIPFTFTETNTGDQPVNIADGPSIDGFTVSQGGQEVWRSNGGINPMVIVEKTLQPGQSETLTATWDGTSFDGSSLDLSGGSFVVTNQLAPDAASASFQIESPLSYSLDVASNSPQSGPPIPFGQPIPLSYTITNPSDLPVTFNLDPADFVVTSSTGGGTVWESDPGAASQAPTSETLQPGQSMTETATWDGTADEGPSAGTDVAGDFQVSVLGAPAGVDEAFLISNPMAWAVTTDRTTYQPGEPVQLAATETNSSALPVTILNSNDTFTVSTSQGDTVATVGASANGSVVTLQPGQSQTLAATWTPDSTIAAGSYLIHFEDNFGGASSPLFTIAASSGGGAGSPPTGPTSSVGSPPTGSTSSVGSPPTGPTSSVGSPGPSPSSPVLPSTSGQPPASIGATLAATRSTSQPGSPVHLALGLENLTGQSVSLSRTAVITVRQGSTVVSRTTKALPAMKVSALRPGRSLHLSTIWSGRPNQAGLKALDPGTYTIEVDGAGYSASTSIRIGASR